VQHSQRPALLNATIVIALASGTLYFLGSVNDSSFLRSLGLPASSLTPPPNELLRLGAASILGFLIDWWLPLLVVGGAALVHTIALAANSEYAEFWRRGPKIPAVLTAVVVAVPLFVLSVSQAVLDGERRASGPVIQRLQPFEFILKGSNDVLTGRVVRYTGTFFVVVTDDGRTAMLNASDVQMAQGRRAAASTKATR